MQLIGNKKYLVFGAAALALTQGAKATLLVYEPFDYTSSNATQVTSAGGAVSIIPGSTATNGGVGLANTYGPNPSSWLQTGAAGPSGTPHQILNGALTAPAGFPTPIGTVSASLRGGSSNVSTGGDYNEMARMNLPYDATAGDTFYYSVLLNVETLTGLTVANTNLTAGNDVFMALNNNPNTTATRPSSFGGALTIRLGSTSGTYDLGIRASTPGSNSNNAGWSGDLTSGTTYLVVGEYQISATPGDGNGVNNLWINPNSSTFGGTAPAVTATSLQSLGTAANDHVNSFLLGAGLAAGTVPNDVRIDELRIGTTYADVTTTPEPSSIGLIGMGLAALVGRRRRRRGPV